MLAEINNFDQLPEYVDKKEIRQKIRTLADYFIDAQNQQLDKNKLMYDPAELERVKIITLRTTKNEAIKTLILKVNNGHKWIIALHGWGDDKYLALHQTYLFSQLGYNVLTFDARGHGQSYGEETDFGFESHQDLLTIINYLKRHHRMNHYGLIGVSTGASTALHHLQKNGYKDSQLKFLISDCGFANLNKALQFLVEQRYALPWWKISHAVRNKFKKYFKFEPKLFDLLDEGAMSRVASTPILFIHGTKDKKVHVSHAKQLHERKIAFENPIQSQLLLVPSVGHKEAITKGTQHYTKGIISFLKALGEI